MPTATSGKAICASGPPCRKLASSQPAGTSEIRVTRPTMKIGMSISVRSSTAPSILARRAVSMADFRPPKIGLARPASVMMAAMPITPAPIMRTSVFQMPNAWPAAPTPAAAGVRDVINGTMMPQAMTRPASIATPTVMPIRWPAPISASEPEAPMPVAPAPVRK